MALDFDLLRSFSVTSRGGRASVPMITTRQRLMSAALSEALSSGATWGGEELVDEDGHPTYVFGLTPMSSPYWVR